MSQAFPMQLLAKSGITPIMCARSRASKLDGVSAKAYAEARCGKRGRLGAGSGRAGGTVPAQQLPTRTEAAGRGNGGRGKTSLEA